MLGTQGQRECFTALFFCHQGVIISLPFFDLSFPSTFPKGRPESNPQNVLNLR